jgi:hypothetical protein
MFELTQALKGDLILHLPAKPNCLRLADQLTAQAP